MSNESLAEMNATKAPPPGPLGLMALYCISIGQVIGAGIVTLVGPAITMTGYSVWLAYIFAIILGFITILPIVFVCSTMRMAGGHYSLIAVTTSKQVTGMFAISQLSSMLSLSLFGTALGMYVNSIFPSVNRTLIGIALLTFFYVINLLGVKIMARVQTVMTWVLIAALLMFAVFGNVKGTNPIFEFSNPDFMPKGFGGIINAMLLFVYSCTGYSFTMNYGRDAKNARRDIPIAILLAVPTLIVLYCGVAMAGAKVLPLAEVAGKPLTFAAKASMPGWLFVLFIIGGPVMALTTTMNSSYPYMCIPMQRSCQDGWFPKSFALPNRFGAPWKILTVCYVLGFIPMALGWSVTVIVNNLMLLNSVQAMLYFYAYYKIPGKFPEAWKKARFHVPNGIFYFLVTLGLFGRIWILIYSFRSLNITIAVVSSAAILLCFVYGWLKSKSPGINLSANVWLED